MAKDLDNELENVLKDTDDVPATAQPIAPAPAAPPKKRSNLVLLVALLVMAAGVVVVFLVGFQGAAIYAMPTDEVVAKADTLQGKRLRVEGDLVVGTLKRPTDCEYRFTIHAKGKELPVVYPKCVIPDTFRDRPEGGVQVTVEGELAKDGKSFEATLVMAKCASKYDPATHEMVLPDGSRVKASGDPNNPPPIPTK